jgi:2,4-dienoyl-CoA reductase-like NADH-dependent reductase (Old Yellow Enzyme family)
MLLQVVEAVQAAVNGDYPIFVKVNSDDLLEGGFSKDEMVEVCTMLEDAGIDAIELSGGTTLAFRSGNAELSFIPIKKTSVYWQQAAEQYKEKISVPLMLVGGIRSFETAEALVEGDIADYISFGRPLVREPDLVKRWKDGDRRKADCISDNGCGWALGKGYGISCVHLSK